MVTFSQEMSGEQLKVGGSVLSTEDTNTAVVAQQVFTSHLNKGVPTGSLPDNLIPNPWSDNGINIKHR